MLKSTVELEASLVDTASAHESDIVFGSLDVMKAGVFTISLIVCQVVIEDQVLDALLLRTLGFLLRPHGNGECAVGW